MAAIAAGSISSTVNRSADDLAGFAKPGPGADDLQGLIEQVAESEARHATM
jgi:hypothetical protein